MIQNEIRGMLFDIGVIYLTILIFIQYIYRGDVYSWENSLDKKKESPESWRLSLYYCSPQEIGARPQGCRY